MSKESCKNNLIADDCLKVMRSLPDNSVDLVMTSPPYEAARTYGIGFNLRGQAWVDWAVERYLECVRVCKGLVVWVVEGQTRDFRWSATPALLMADLHRRGIKLRKPTTFARVGISGSGGPDWLRNDWEFCVCASKGRLPWSNNTAMGHPPRWAPGGAMSHRLSDGSRRNQWGGGEKSTGGERQPDGTRRQAVPRPSHVIADKLHTKRKPNGDMEVQGYKAPVLANPGNIIKCKVGGGVMGSKLAHENEAPFPESLAEFFIRSFCPPGGIVLDPFCGSGTTCAVAKKTGREWLGIDIRESQVDLTMRRLKTVQPELPVKGGAKLPEPEKPVPDFKTVQDAAHFLAMETTCYDTSNLIMSSQLAEDAYRKAVKKHRPDAGGDPEKFKLATTAIEMLRQYHARVK